MFKHRKGIAAFALALATVLPQTGPASAAGIFDVADTVISYNRERAEKEIAEALGTATSDDGWKTVSSWLMLRKEETYAKIEKEISERLSKVSTPGFAAWADSWADGFVSLARKFLTDGNAGLLFVVGYGNGDVVSAGNSYYYVYPFETKGDADAVKYVREKVASAASESEDAFVEACSKYRIRYAKVADTMKATAYVGESRGAKKDMPITMFSSTRNPIPDKAVLDSVKARHGLFYFGYVSSDELRSYFGGKKDMELRGMDAFVSIGSETLFSGVVEPQKLVMEAKVSDLGVFHTAEYSKKAGELPITVAFALLGIAFGTVKALGFRSRQRTLLAMTGDRI